MEPEYAQRPEDNLTLILIGGFLVALLVGGLVVVGIAALIALAVRTLTGRRRR